MAIRVREMIIANPLTRVNFMDALPHYGPMLEAY
jgi:hypothetical protein